MAQAMPGARPIRAEPAAATSREAATVLRVPQPSMSGPMGTCISAYG